MSELAALQSRFAASLLAGDAPEMFRGDPALAARRFALYRGNLTAHWERALGAAYPVLRQLVGEEFFRALAREYGRATPFAEGDLNRFGARLAGFLEGFAPVADYPYFPDLARLEWALHRAHYAADEPALALEALAALSPEALDAARLRLRAGVVLLASRWAIDAIWQAHQPGGVPPPNLEADTRIAVCRPHWRAELLALDAGEFAALCALDAGATLGEALEAGAAAGPAFDPARALPRWLAAGLLATPMTHPRETRE